jgi:hypothetical protein
MRLLDFIISSSTSWESHLFGEKLMILLPQPKNFGQARMSENPFKAMIAIASE